MTQGDSQTEVKRTTTGGARWQWRDTMAAALLAVASASFTVWQNGRLTVLWDASYTLETATRIAQGQMPYRDFPLAHAPLTFLIQALLIRLTGRVFWHAVAYAAVASGLAAVLAWRVMLAALRNRVPAAWITSLLLAAPLAFLSVYSILPFPSYDCDCVLAVLAFLVCWMRVAEEGARGHWRAVAAGTMLVPPVFFKQNIGLPLAACAVAVVVVLLALRLWRGGSKCVAQIDPRALTAVLAGAAGALAVALFAIETTVGLNNFFQWTVRFAAQRRMPGLDAMMGIYYEPALLWELPFAGAGFLLLSFGARRLWVRVLAVPLLAAPLLWTLAGFVMNDDAEDRASSLLALWPLLLILAIALALFRFARAPGMRTAVPLLVLAAIHGTMLSQQLWGSTYALWPLLAILLAEMIAAVHAVDRGAANRRGFAAAPVLAASVCVTMLVCGGGYAASEERLSYADVLEGPVQHSSVPALRGMAVRGEYLPEFEELLDFAAKEIPWSDGVILLPGEELFYFATGREPRFPVLLFDPATDPLSPAQLAAETRRRNIRWLVVKLHLQMREDPTPDRDAALAALLGEFRPYRTLRGYAIYRRTE